MGGIDMLHLILYDLRNKKQEHENRLCNLIETHAEDFCKITDSAFVVSSRLSIKQWYNLLEETLESDDYFFVTQLQSDQFTGFLSDRAANWFSQCV
jgi:hypothetical protein